MLLLAHIIGKNSEVGGLGFFVERQAFFGRNALARSDFFGDFMQGRGKAWVA